MTIVEFITAMADEDEEAARDADEQTFPGTLPRGTHLVYGLERAGFSLDYQAFSVVYDPARALREVAATRNILARYADCLARMEDDDYPYEVARDQAREYEDFVLPNLAAAHSDHPDYRQEWDGADEAEPKHASVWAPGMRMPGLGDLTPDDGGFLEPGFSETADQMWARLGGRPEETS